MPVTVLSFPSSPPPSPALTQHRGTCLDFDAAFPSIIKTAVRLRQAKINNTLEAFTAIADVFIMCATTAIHEIHRSCPDSHIDGSYELAKSAAELVISLMHGKLKTDISDSAAVDIVLELADMVVANLQELTKVGLHIAREKKPLPSIPTDRGAGTDDGFSVKERRLSFLDYELVNSDVHEESYDTPSHRFLFGTRLRGLFASVLSATSSEQLTSSATLVNGDSQSAFSLNTATSEGKPYSKRLPDITYVLRPYILPSNAGSSKIDVEVPLPTEGTSSVYFNSTGKVKGATFSDLVGLLTSKDAVLDLDLLPAFFAGFRIFSSAKQFFEELKKRFDGEAPDHLDATQLRVWTREAFLTRLRVGKILVLWLTDYWQPGHDDEILGHLHGFAVERVRNELPRSLATPILEMIDSRMTGDEVYVTSHKDRYFKILASQVAQTKIAVTGFSHPDTFDDDIDNVLALFDTEVGKEEFTRQLTSIASAMFRRINPRDVVIYWHKHTDSELGPALSEATNFARSLAMFVIHSVVTQYEKAQLCRRIEFWINTATLLASSELLRLALRICKHYTFGGQSPETYDPAKLTHKSKGLSQHSKVQFRRLDQFFSGRLNYVQVRNAMAEKTAATIPLLVPLKQDIVGIKQMPWGIEAAGERGDQALVNLVPYRILMKTMRAMESSLIPYGFPKNAKFEQWLNKVIRRFPLDEEEKLYNSFYEESRRIEPKDKELEHMSNTWTQCEVIKQGGKIILELSPDEELSTHQDIPQKGIVKPFKSLLDSLRR